MTANPFSVSYRSRGALLVIGDRAVLKDVLPSLPTGLKTLVVVRGDIQGLQGSRHTRVVPGSVMKVRGHLGCFRASAAGADGPLDLGPLSPNDDGLFDLVLDLYADPLIDHEVPPLGYARCPQGKPNLSDKLKRLEKLVGNVNKPRYFDFDEQRCAHDRLGLVGCRRCLEVCPAGAIASGGKDGIQIDPYLCRGCGSCALVCPTGAASYAKPRPAVTLRNLAARLDTMKESSVAPVLAIKAASGPTLPQGIPMLEVTAVGSIGMELWFSALALGASRVMILRSGLLPPTTERLLREQVQLARRLLEAVGQAAERIRLVDDPLQADWAGLSNTWSPLPLRTLNRYRDKRSLLLAALRHIADPEVSNRHALEDIPFGGIGLRASACTLCHACSRICPTDALRQRDGGLALRDADCVQCGLCVAACPENALTADPGLYPDLLMDQEERILKADAEPFHCVQCGKPFASRVMVEVSMAHVGAHPMFQGEGRRLLQMCMECRQKETAGLN